MNFKYKCYLQNIFSGVRRGENLNYLFQKFVTKSLPVSDEQFCNKVGDACGHYSNFATFNRVEVNTKRYYEFGAGWELIVPLTIGLLGFDVYAIDIKKLVIPELILDSHHKFRRNKNVLPFEFKDIPSESFTEKNILNKIKEAYHVTYLAPRDARDTQFDDESFDFVSSSVTLEHIPQSDIALIIAECYRVLKKGGVLSMIIDYKDHWSYFDKSISAYNFLKYSSDEWKKYNPSLHYQNRLRHRNYLDLISATKFEIVKEVTDTATDSDMETLQELKIDKEFQHLNLSELGIKSAEIVLRK